jgi:predicted metal-dependent HD superfamily phosphohydrolase
MLTDRNDASSTRQTSTAVRDSLLRQRFVALWQRCLNAGADSDPAAVWQEVARRYAEPHRHYHDKSHLAHCMEQLDLAAGQVREPDRVELAIWFHDVVNEPGVSDNEQQSAELFRRLADGVMDADLIDDVVGLILVTTHQRQPEVPDHQFICDIDLASFGCPWECFLNDSVAVKAEFKGPDEDYYRGKKAFLEALLQRPKIFISDFFNRRYEDQARDNIQRLLALIDQGHA